MQHIKKIALYALFGMVCLSLWQSWMQYQQQHTGPGTKAAPSKQASVAKSTQPESQSATKQRQSVAETADTAQVKKNLSNQSNWITITTDTLRVQIDPQGGHIVEVDLLKYFQTLEKKKPIRLLSPESDDFFITKDGVISEDSGYENVTYNAAKSTYQLQPDEQSLKVTLNGKTKEGLSVQKVYHFDRGDYTIGMERRLINQSGQTWQGGLYNQIMRKKPQKKSSYFRLNTFTGAAYSTPETPYNKLSYDKIANTGLNQEIKGGWVAFQQPYFLAAWVPDQQGTYRYFAQHNEGDLYTIGYQTQPIKLNPGEQKVFSSKLYTGPEIASYLKPLAKGLDLTVDYGWLWFISALLFWIMNHIHSVVGNWGWSIILVTVLIKLVFFKLSESSYRSMAKMRQLQPQLEKLKEKYGDDRQKMGQATMELYKQEKVNPLGGCLPILVQIPVFIGLYYVLIESVQLRHAPFMLWIHDLSARDPYYILPVLMGLSMFVQQKLSPQPPDPNQARMMMALPVVFTLFFMTFPSGLVLYWFVNNCLTIAQQWFIMKRMERQPQKQKA